jgi:hypothetical protein
MKNYRRQLPACDANAPSTLSINGFTMFRIRHDGSPRGFIPVPVCCHSEKVGLRLETHKAAAGRGGDRSSTEARNGVIALQHGTFLTNSAYCSIVQNIWAPESILENLS